MERSAEDVAAQVASASDALAEGRWQEARDGFEAALKIEESGGAVSVSPSPCGGCVTP
jgi:hypothetical protein